MYTGHGSIFLDSIFNWWPLLSNLFPLFIIPQNKPEALPPGRQTTAWLPAWSCPALCQTSRHWNLFWKQTTTVGFWCLRFCIVKTYMEHEHVDIFEKRDVFLEITFFEVLHVKLLGCSYFYRCCKMLTFQSKWKWRQAEINGEQLREAHPWSQ